MPMFYTNFTSNDVYRGNCVHCANNNLITVAVVQGQLCALRRISRSYDECGEDGVILMNKRLAQDNNTLSCTLSAVKRELRSANQVQYPCSPHLKRELRSANQVQYLLQ